MSLLKQAREYYRHEGVLGLIFKGVVTAKDRILFVFWDKFNVISFDRLYGAEYYKKMLDEDALSDSRSFAREVQNRIDVNSVIDFGCGPGRFLLPFYEADVKIKGVDASSAAKSESVVPAERIKQHDLRQPLNTDKNYDVALCIEVLEHLPRHATETVVRSIAGASDIAIVTAAPPGQGGTHHVNEQPATYWINKFESTGMSYDESLTSELRSAIEPKELDWLSSNIMVFKHKD
jgi:SAM-dependent methyltransferase